MLQHPAESGLLARLHPLAAHAGEVLLQRALPQPRHAQAAVRLGPAADRPVRRVPAVRSRGQYRARPLTEILTLMENICSSVRRAVRRVREQLGRVRGRAGLPGEVPAGAGVRAQQHRGLRHRAGDAGQYSTPNTDTRIYK